MITLAIIDKDPSADLDYGFDWTLWLDGDIITSSSWSVDQNSGILIHNSSVSALGTQTAVWLAGGRLGLYQVTNVICTLSLRKDARSFTLNIGSR